MLLPLFCLRPNLISRSDLAPSIRDEFVGTDVTMPGFEKAKSYLFYFNVHSGIFCPICWYPSLEVSRICTDPLRARRLRKAFYIGCEISALFGIDMKTPRVTCI